MNYRDTIERIIKEEILTLANSTVEILQKVDEDWPEECDNLSFQVCHECAEPLSADDVDAYNCPECDTDFAAGQVEYETKEIMQWFIVTAWLADKLRVQGEAVWAPNELAFWGRCGCGYSLTDETCLKNIAEALSSHEERSTPYHWCDTDTV